VFIEGLGGLKANWSAMFLVLCLATLILGNILALVQTNVKRMLAYSSIAHAGYALIGVVATGHMGNSSGIASVLLYLSLYAFMTFGAFAIVAMLRKGGIEGEDIDDFTGLAKRHPVAALLMLIFMVSLAGIPPTAGFIGKLYVFMSAVEAGLPWLAAVALIFAVISAYYYLRLVMVMYMREPSDLSNTSPRMVMSPALSIVLACAVAGVVIFGIYPNPLVNFAIQAVSALK
jgi:NADH-quinone oxidoreductase subunit N